MAYTYLTIAILFEVAGTISLKMSEGFSKPLYGMGTAVGYGVAIYLLALCLKELGVGFTYAVWAGAGIVLTAVAGTFLFGEKPDLPGLIGIGLIVSGIVILSGWSMMGKS